MKAITPLILIALLAFTACKKKTSDPEPDPAPTTTTTTGGTTTGSTPSIDINSAPQVSYTMDGTTFSYLGDGVSYIGSFGNGGNAQTNGKIYVSFIGRIPDGKYMITITKGELVPAFGNTVSDSEFKAFFPLTSIPYSPDATNGINIEIKDANDVLWTSYYGTDQTGSTFNIVQTRDEQQNNPYTPNYPYTKTYITFSCKVYNASGAMKTITNGKYVGHFGII